MGAIAAKPLGGMKIRDGAFKIHNKPDNRSDFLKALDQVDHQAKEIDGVCPYGCNSDVTDDLGYCEHLIGFTNAELPEGTVTAAPVPDAVIELLSGDDARDGIQRRVVTKARDKVQVGDHLVKITCTRRVYRDKAAPAPVPQAKEGTSGRDAQPSAARVPTPAPIG